MGIFFKGWQRKVGVVTLLMACGFMAAWIRSISIDDWYLFGFNNQDSYVSGNGRIVTKSRAINWLSSSARYGLVWSREEDESSLSWFAAGWHSCPTDSDFDPTDSNAKYANSIMDCRWQLFGIEIAKFHGYDQGEYETFSYWRISYVSIVLPLIVISLLLLVIRPRKLIQKKITEPIAENTASIRAQFLKGWQRKWQNLKLVIAAILIGGFAVALYARWSHAANYPYGWSRCRVKQLMFALEQYAEAHDGHYPAGKGSPEASLSLLRYHEPGSDANVLRGKTVSEESVQAIFDQKGLLGPDTCGWHYVDGLTQNDDWRLAHFWDKAGLGHSGERMPNGGREVFFVGRGVKLIPDAEWPQFLQEQRLLLAERDDPAVKGGALLVGQIKLPSGELLDHFEGRYQLEQTEPWMIGGNKMVLSGDNFRLKWMGTDFRKDGEMTLVFVLPDLALRSKQVTVEVKNHRPSKRMIVFEMEEMK